MLRPDEQKELADLWDSHNREVWPAELVETASDLRIVLACKLADAAALAREVVADLKANDAAALLLQDDMGRGRFLEDMAIAQAALVRALGEIRAVQLPSKPKPVPCVLVPWFAEALAMSG